MTKNERASASKQSNTKSKQALGDAAEQWLARNRSLVLRQTPLWAQSLAGILISLGTLAVLGGILFRIDEVVTVTGQLESLTGSTEVKTPVGGKVSAVFFKDGQLVRKGDLLVRFDTRQAADEKSTLNRLLALEASDLNSQLKLLQEREQVIKQKLNTSRILTYELRKLVNSGGFQRMQYLQQLDQQYELQSQLSSIQLEKRQIILTAEKSIGQMRNRLHQSELQLQYQNVVSPVNGIVFQPKARVDGVFQPGETILTLVPQQGLKAVVFVSNKDIGFVKAGQIAKVRVDAFPFSRYGELQGKVVQIGADALPPDQTLSFYRFPVKLNLNRYYLQTQGAKIPLRSGMAITANLKLREKRVISLLSDLLVDQTESIKGIRQQ